jgi:hypothetical protein
MQTCRVDEERKWGVLLRNEQRTELNTQSAQQQVTKVGKAEYENVNN